MRISFSLYVLSQVSALPTMAPPFSQPHIEPSPKRVRVLFGGKYVVDTTQAKLV